MTVLPTNCSALEQADSHCSADIFDGAVNEDWPFAIEEFTAFRIPCCSSGPEGISALRATWLEFKADILARLPMLLRPPRLARGLAPKKIKRSNQHQISWND